VSTTSDEAFLGLNNYLQLEGLAYRLVPIRDDNQGFVGLPGRINTSVLYHRLMNQYDYSQYADSTIFLSEDYTRTASNIKLFFLRLAEALVRENKMDSTINAMDRCYTWFPPYNIPYGELDSYFAEFYIYTRTTEGVEKGAKLYHAIIDQFLLENTYYEKFKGNKAAFVARGLSYNRRLLAEINDRCRSFKSVLDEEQGKLLDSVIEKTRAYTSGNQQQTYY
jgi:hypothetical protein